MQFNLFQLQQNYYDRRQSAAAAAAISFSVTLYLSLSFPLPFSLLLSLSVKLFINKFWREETKRSKRQFQLNRHALPLPHPLPAPLVQFAHEMQMLLLLLMLPPTGQRVCCLATIATASKLAPNLQLSGRDAPPT